MVELGVSCLPKPVKTQDSSMIHSTFSAETPIANCLKNGSYLRLTKVLVCILALQFLPTVCAEDKSFTLDLPHQEVVGPNSKPPGAPQPLSAPSYQAMDIEVMGKKQRVQIEIRKDGLLPEKFFTDSGAGVIWALITRYFSALDEFPGLKTIESHEIAKEDSLSFEWVYPPEFDYHGNSFRFYLLIKRGSYLHAYAKTIFLTKRGLINFEINGPHNETSLKIFELLPDKLNLAKEETYSHNQPVKRLKAERRFREIILPIGAKMTQETKSINSGGFLEENRKATGVFFLIFSILFFLFIAPRMKS